jgi:hypothetical protein
MDCHRALIEGHCDAPTGTLLALVPTGSSSFRLNWNGLRVGEGGRFQATLSLRNLITGYSVVAADTREELVSPGKATHVVVAPALFLGGLVEEGRIYFPLILLAYLATGVFLMLRAERLGIRRGHLWLLLPLASAPLLLQGRPKAAWLAQALQSLLLSYNLLASLTASLMFEPRAQALRIVAYTTVWWLGWAAGFYWASRQATAEREPTAPDLRWAWACLIPQALARAVPGLAQLLQGRAGRGLTFLFAALALRVFLQARLWWVLLSQPPLLLANKFEAVTKYDGMMLRIFGFEALFVLCLVEAAWFAWRASKAPGTLAEQEAKAG